MTKTKQIHYITEIGTHRMEVKFHFCNKTEFDNPDGLIDKMWMLSIINYNVVFACQDHRNDCYAYIRDHSYGVKTMTYLAEYPGLPNARPKKTYVINDFEGIKCR